MVQSSLMTKPRQPRHQICILDGGVFIATLPPRLQHLADVFRDECAPTVTYEYLVRDAATISMECPVALVMPRMREDQLVRSPSL